MLSPSCLVAVWLHSFAVASSQHLLELTATHNSLWTWWPAWFDSLSGVSWQLTKWQRLDQSNPYAGSVHYSPQLWAEARRVEWVVQQDRLEICSGWMPLHQNVASRIKHYLYYNLLLCVKIIPAWSQLHCAEQSFNITHVI